MMKRTVLLFATGLLMTAVAQATPTKTEAVDQQHPYHEPTPVILTEQGITFYVYADGKVAYKSPRVNHNRNYIQRRNAKHTPVNHRSRMIETKLTQRNYIRYNRAGQLAHVGNVQLTYDGRGHVVQIGRVPLIYQRGMLTQVGELRIANRQKGLVLEYNSDLRDDRRIKLPKDAWMKR